MRIPKAHAISTALAQFAKDGEVGFSKQDPEMIFAFLDVLEALKIPHDSYEHDLDEDCVLVKAK